ncbi:MAG: PAS domain S-box protein [Candidatus Nanoarchaeia archaeon]
MNSNHKKTTESLSINLDFKQMFEKSRDGFVAVDTSGRIVYANKAYCDMLGYTLEELRAKKDFYQITPQRWHGWENREIWHNKLLKNGESGYYEKEYIRKDGTIFPVALWAYTVRNEKGEIEYLWAVVRDITEYKKYENALIESRNYLQSILDSINDAVFVDDGDTMQIIDVNQKMCEMYGYSKEEALALSVGELSLGEPPYSQEDALKWLNKAKETGNPQTFEWLAKRKGGSLFWAEVTISYVKIGGATRFIVTVRDIEYRKRVQIELERAAAEWQKTFDASRDAIWIMDKYNRVLRVNKTVESVLGMSPDSLISKHCWEVLHGGTPHPDCPQLRAIKSLKRETMEIELNGKWFEITVDPIIDSNGKYDGAIHSIADITEKRKLFEELSEREERFRRLVLYSQTHIYVISKEGKILFSSPSVKKQLGITPGEIIGNHFKDYICPEDLNKFEYALGSIFSESVSSISVEYRVKHIDGKYRWHRSVLAPLPDEQGNIVSVIGNAVDFTEQRLAEEQFKILFEEMQNGFALHEIILDNDGKPIDYRFLQVNPAFERITGLKAKDIIGKTVLEILPETEKYWIETYGKVALTGTPAHFEQYSQELKKWFDVNAFQVATLQFACIFSDITDKKKAEVSLKQNLEELKRWQSVMLDYSDRSQQLKKEVNQLLEELGRPPRYLSVTGNL